VYKRQVKTDGSVVQLDSIVNTDLEPGDRLVIKTPGGGGFGSGPVEEAG
jgi:N-methylhydantoinase B/oxoprolinase/acetone carboxylase alpha subunit